MTANSGLAEIREILLSYTAPVYIFSHQHPDGDSVGSTVGLYYLLRQAGVRAIPVLPAPHPEIYGFMLGNLEILTPPVDIRGRTAVVLDCGSLQRLGETGQSLEGAARVINIDHHLNNQMFGDYNYVDSRAAAVGQIIYNMFAHDPFPPEAAQALFTAVYTDTGRFSYSNTTSATLASAADLVELGANPQRVYNEIHQNKTQQYYFLLAEVLADMNLSCQGKVASIALNRHLLAKHPVADWELDDLNDYPRSLRGVSVSVILKEVEADTVKVSLRSKDRVNVASVASKLGGGGHYNAAGVTLNMDLAQAQEQVISQIEAELSL